MQTEDKHCVSRCVVLTAMALQVDQPFSVHNKQDVIAYTEEETRDIDRVRDCGNKDEGCAPA